MALLPAAFLMVCGCGITLLVLGFVNSQDRAVVIALGTVLTELTVTT